MASNRTIILGNNITGNDVNGTGNYDGICITANRTIIKGNILLANYRDNIRISGGDRNLVDGNIAMDATTGSNFTDSGTNTLAGDNITS